IGGLPRSNSGNSGGTPGVESKPPPARKRKRPSEDALLQQLQEQGKLVGALHVSGRNSSLKNSTVNGIYAKVDGGFKGRMAYERVSTRGKNDPKRCLFFSEDKARWKISEALGDRHNFAFLKVKDGGKKPPSEAGSKSYWSFFDGKEIGWQEDREVKCVAYDQAKRPRKENGEEPSKAGMDGQKQDAAEYAASAQDDSSDSASSSSGESDSDEASGGESVSSGRSASNKVPAPVEPAAAGPGGAPKIRYRAVAKMLARAGLRCSCHFAQECPARIKAAA
ncbi:GOR, partial [Symbiodinium pilosum]